MKQMKYILVVGDGMADYPVPELGNKTPLQAAQKPNMDSIAAEGQSGLIKNVPDQCTPGSDVAICSVLGYDPKLYCPGRGPLEAPSMGVKLGKHDTAYRCNLITEKNGCILDYSAGHITTPESAQLIRAVDKVLGKKGEIEFYPGLDYRHLMVIRNFARPDLIECTPPHDATGVKVSNVMPKAQSPEV
jgi:2,3-bisphosphoglycerate-independent phosphoglycerate mutase